MPVTLVSEDDVISRYTRAQAIEDGVLVDVSELAREAGFRFPVAMTPESFETTVSVPAGLEDRLGETGRLWDVLYLASCEAKRSGEASELTYKVRVQVVANRARDISLKKHCGPGAQATASSRSRCQGTTEGWLRRSVCAASLFAEMSKWGSHGCWRRRPHHPRSGQELRPLPPHPPRRLRLLRRVSLRCYGHSDN